VGSDIWLSIGGVLAGVQELVKAQWQRA